jgi:hypothetical protein
VLTWQHRLVVLFYHDFNDWSLEESYNSLEV